jgi:hypothetical protein
MTAGERHSLAVLAEILERVEARIEVEAATSKADRAEILAGMGKQRDDLQTLHIKMDRTDERLAKIEPVTDMVMSVRTQISGMVILLGLIGTVGGMVWLLVRDRAAQIWNAVVGG